MTDNNRGLENTEYLSVTFDEIKEKLLERAKTYYPDTYNDFNKTSFGSLMFDLVAMVGEQLNFYAQFVANEGFIEYARTGVGLQNAARMSSVSLHHSAPRAVVHFSCPIVVSEDQINPDSTGVYTILKGALCTGPGNQIVETQQDIVIRPTIDVNHSSVTTQYNEDGGRPLVYYVEKPCACIAGEVRRFVVDIETYEGVLSIKIPDTTCTDIMSVIDSEGNRYYEVDSLGLNSVETGIRYFDADTNTPVEKMIDMPVPRRFQVKEEGAHKLIEFGQGSEPTLKIKDVPYTSAELFLNKQAHSHVTSREITRNRYLENDRYGVAPKNTTLTITYRSVDTENSNIPIAAINTLLEAEIVFEDESGFGESNMTFVRNNIVCNNGEPFNGVTRFQSTKEIAMTCKAAAGAQGRAVTERDIVSMCYVMPNNFGQITKASVSRDALGLRRMLNLYCISEDGDKNLEKASSLVKENLKKWLSSVKMVTDRIDIFDAQILNIGLNLDITLKDKSEANTAMSKIREFLFDEITLTTPEIGQAFSIGEIEQILGTMPIVQRVNKVQVSVKNGTGYSSTRFDIMPNTAPDGSMIYMPQDFIWEIKKPTDIIGTIK